MKSPYKAVVHFTTRTKVTGVEVKQSLPHVDKEHAERWIASMLAAGNKIWNVSIVENN